MYKYSFFQWLSGVRAWKGIIGSMENVCNFFPIHLLYPASTHFPLLYIKPSPDWEGPNHDFHFHSSHSFLNPPQYTFFATAWTNVTTGLLIAKSSEYVGPTWPLCCIENTLLMWFLFLGTWQSKEEFYHYEIKNIPQSNTGPGVRGQKWLSAPADRAPDERGKGLSTDPGNWTPPWGTGRWGKFCSFPEKQNKVISIPKC